MRLIVVSGRSGSGKSTALHVLEDAGFYCIDNLPAALLPALAQQMLQGSENVFEGLAVSIDARNTTSDLAHFPDYLQQLAQFPIETEIVFLDALDATLLKRFSETRRKHPLSDDHTGLREAIDLERELLEPLASRAALTIDTSNLTLHELRDLIRKRVVQHSSTDLALLFQSFGFKRAVPSDADFVFDIRCLPNPHWKPDLRALSGLDAPVQQYLGSEPQVVQMIGDITQFLESWIPQFVNSNRSYLTIAIGCTGGQHRSVYVCEQLKQHFSALYPNVQTRHRELGS